MSKGGPYTYRKYTPLTLSDEYYTQYSTIEKELVHYADHFRDKSVFCPCDNYRVSNFFRYFKDNFTVLGIKKLVTLCLDGVGSVTTKDGWTTEFTVEDGDFRGEESVGLLAQCDGGRKQEGNEKGAH